MLLTQQMGQVDGWQPLLDAQRAEPYFARLDEFVTGAYATDTVYPPQGQIFAALQACPAERVRVVILGQDPYHEPGQAMGLAFSVPQGCKAPPSLKNIGKELESEFGPGAAAATDLTPWAKQGVLLLNTVLTVGRGRAFSHAGQGWEAFTRAVVEYAAGRGSGPLAAILWGKPAQRFAPIFEQAAGQRPVLVLQSAHPSPLSAYRGFFGSAPFGKVNAFLRQNGAAGIDWRLRGTAGG